MRRKDSGYATVSSVGIIAAVSSLCVLVAGLGAHVAQSHRAQQVADLTAVAAAAAQYRGDNACRAARDTSALNSATVASCEVAGGDVIVSVAIGSRGGVVAWSKAGPL